MSDFKKGDIVVCMYNKHANNLKLYHKYTFNSYFDDGNDSKNLKNRSVIIINGGYFTFLSNRFISLEQYRLLKINKIKQRYEITRSR